MHDLELLQTLLAPQGILTVTTGSGEIADFLRMRYGSDAPAAVRARWLAEFDRLADARAVIVGVPCDVGAGFERGSFKGPLGIRTALLAEQLYPHLSAAGVVDLGDVRVNPQLLDDSYYSGALLDSVRRARGVGADVPVSPLTALRAALDAIARLNPSARVLLLGGDHSLSRVPVEALVGRGNPAADLGVLDFDAHTDLLDLRDGVPYNFATWAHHANDAIGRGGRLVQVGVRVSGQPRAHWESTLQLRQMRMDEIVGRPHAEVADEVVGCFEAAGVRRIYVSNDIDGTDPTFAASTGTMELDGLDPRLVRAIVAAVAARFEIVGADVVEVAPPLKWHVPGEPARTLRTAASYAISQLQAMLGAPLPNPFTDVQPAEPTAVANFPLFT